MPDRILVVEDEPELAALLRDYLVREGFEAECVSDGDAALAVFRAAPPALMLLDIMLPGSDGLTVCREIRRSSEMPVIMVTARVEEIDRLLGLELGADDYICKPFSPREVVARVKAVLRRARAAAARNDGMPAGIQLDEDRFRLMLHGVAVDLTAVEFRLLKALAVTPGRICSRSQLMDQIYDDHRVVSDRTIDSHIKKLRRKIADAAPDHELIHSVYGVGYKFDPDTGPVADSKPAGA